MTIHRDISADQTATARSCRTRPFVQASRAWSRIGSVTRAALLASTGTCSTVPRCTQLLSHRETIAAVNRHIYHLKADHGLEVDRADVIRFRRPTVATQPPTLHASPHPARFSLPDEVTDLVALVEGSVTQVTVNAYERDPEARRRCIAAHGTICCVCGFCFGAVYGPVAEGYIHVHHLLPLSEAGGAHTVDPVVDLRPVCPNCHAVLHRRVPAYTIEEVRAFLRYQMLARPGGEPNPTRKGGPMPDPSIGETLS